MSIPEKILQAGCDAYAATFLNGNGSLGDGIEAAYLAIHEHDDWVRAGPPAWTGEGLPPVGTVCEYKPYQISSKWYQVEIIAHFRNKAMVAAFIPTGDDGKTVAQAIAECFRPIRTPEQIAEEARIAELNLMVGAIKDYPGGRHGVDHLTQLKIHEEACINLYDAGWRKQVES